MSGLTKIDRFSPFQSGIALDSHNSAVIATTGSAENDRFKALLYCTLLAFQFGLQPIIASKLTPSGVSKSSVVVATELAKILIAFVTIMGDSPTERKKLLQNWRFYDSVKLAAVPATLYAIQNLFVQYGYSYLDSMTFNLLNQTKVFVISNIFFFFKNA